MSIKSLVSSIKTLREARYLPAVGRQEPRNETLFVVIRDSYDSRIHHFFIFHSAFGIQHYFQFRTSYLVLRTWYIVPFPTSTFCTRRSTFDINRCGGQVASIRYQDEKRILVHTSLARRGGYFVLGTLYFVQSFYFRRRIPEYGFIFSYRGDHYRSSAHTGPFPNAHP